MGASLVYLKEPIKDKEVERDQKGTLSYAAVGMQGWRINMEDSHIANIGFDQTGSLFGVFDGHGGVEVAQYCKRNYERELKDVPNFKMKNWEQALQDSFLKIDEILETPSGKQAMQDIAQEFPK
jgi:serine/threonine protein phosphatase PrpC